jgi:sialic acid synthase SpsE
VTDVNLRAMLTLGEALGRPVGYSDHTLGIHVAVMAATLGAVCIEKHFTLDRDLPGPDHSASLTPDVLAQMVAAVRDVPVILGDARKAPTRAETEIRSTIRKSLVAAVAIDRGTVIERKMVTVKRPEGGIEPAGLEALLGRRTRVAIDRDERIHWDQVEPEPA